MRKHMLLVLLFLAMALAGYLINQKLTSNFGVQAEGLYKIGSCVKYDEMGVTYKIKGVAKGMTLTEVLVSEKYPNDSIYKVGHLAAWPSNENPHNLRVVPCKEFKDLIPVSNEKDCTLKGGAWIFNGNGATLKGIKTCHYLHPDANKECTDGNDCGSGICFANEYSDKGLCAQYAKSSFCTQKPIMVDGKKARETNCIIE